MQGRYVGDAVDFGKHGLLRSLCRGDERGAALRLGVLSYRFDGDDLRPRLTTGAIPTISSRHPMMNGSYTDATTNSSRKCSIS